MSEIQELLQKHDYQFVLSVKDNLIRLQIPARKLEPATEAFAVTYKIEQDKILSSIEGQAGENELECPLYAARTVILMDVRNICENFGFSTKLVQFRRDADIIEEEEFFQAMWPKELEQSDEIRSKEYDLRRIVSNAVTSLIPFEQSFLFEAQQAHVEEGYDIVSNLFFGEIVNE